MSRSRKRGSRAKRKRLTAAERAQRYVDALPLTEFERIMHVLTNSTDTPCRNCKTMHPLNLLGKSSLWCTRCIADYNWSYQKLFKE